MPSKKRRRFGSLRALPSGRVQARYVCPVCLAMHPAHTTFDTETDADRWLAGVDTDVARQVYVCPVERQRAEAASRAAQRPFRDYAERWLEDRELKPRTRMLYRRQLAELLPTFGDVTLTAITRDMVEDWYRDMKRERSARPTGNAHVYSLLRTIMGSAVKEGRLAANPCQLEKVSSSGRRQVAIKTATYAELDAIADGMPAPYALAVHLAAFCALRFGELAELRRRDVDLSGELPVLNVSRAVVQREGRTIVGTPKSAQSVRSVHAPPDLRDLLVEQLAKHAQPGPDGLLFPSTTAQTGRGCDCGHRGCVGGHWRSQAMYRAFMPAREAAGRTDLRWHDLRHTGAVEAAREGATLAETMARLGHSTVAAAMRYQHATAERDQELARRMARRRADARLQTLETSAG